MTSITWLMSTMLFMQYKMKWASQAPQPKKRCLQYPALLMLPKAAWDNVLTAIGGGGDLREAMNGLQTALFGGKDGGGLLA